MLKFLVIVNVPNSSVFFWFRKVLFKFIVYSSFRILVLDIMLIVRIQSALHHFTYMFMWRFSFTIYETYSREPEGDVRKYIHIFFFYPALLISIWALFPLKENTSSLFLYSTLNKKGSFRGVVCNVLDWDIIVLHIYVPNIRPRYEYVKYAQNVHYAYTRIGIRKHWKLVQARNFYLPFWVRNLLTWGERDTHTQFPSMLIFPFNSIECSPFRRPKSDYLPLDSMTQPTRRHSVDPNWSRHGELRTSTLLFGV